MHQCLQCRGDCDANVDTSNRRGHNGRDICSNSAELSAAFYTFGLLRSQHSLMPTSLSVTHSSSDHLLTKKEYSTVHVKYSYSARYTSLIATPTWTLQSMRTQRQRWLREQKSTAVSKSREASIYSVVPNVEDISCNTTPTQT